MTPINHNSSALMMTTKIASSLHQNNINLQKSLEGFSTGLRINKAPDDVGELLASNENNSLERLSKNLSLQEANRQSAESTIGDVRFAKEITELTRNQILSQSTKSMHSQANHSPQVVLELV